MCDPRIRTVGILIFDEVEVLDFCGPFEVFASARPTDEGGGDRRLFRALTIAEETRLVTCRGGLLVQPNAAFDDHPPLDLLVVPGGQGTRREVENVSLLAWIARAAADCRWVTSVCTGAMLLTAAGPAKGRRVTTHWGYVEPLRQRGEAAEVLENRRYVRDGNVVTAAGVSAGIDMALWLTGQLHGADFARAVQKAMEYDPAPPYAAEV